MPIRIKPWHCIAFIMLGLIAYASIAVWNQPMTWEEHTAKMWGYEAEFDEVMRELNALSEEFYATLSPADRAEIRKRLPDDARERYPTLYDDVTPAQPADPTWSDRQRKARRKLNRLIKRYDLLMLMPVLP
jgi:hypothetical protein